MEESLHLRFLLEGDRRRLGSTSVAGSGCDGQAADLAAEGEEVADLLLGGLLRDVANVDGGRHDGVRGMYCVEEVDQSNWSSEDL